MNDNPNIEAYNQTTCDIYPLIDENAELLPSVSVTKAQQI